MADRIIRQSGVRVGGAGSVPRIQFSTGAARALQGFSQNLSNLAGMYQDRLDQQAEAEASDQGAIDGATGDLSLRDYSTIRGRAYNQAAITSFVTTMETNAIAKVSELENTYRNDPDGLQAALDDYRRGRVEKLREQAPAAAVAMDQQFQMRAAPAVARARQARFDATRERAQASLIANEIAMQGEVKTIGADLFNENPERSANAAHYIGSMQAQLARVYDATDADGKPLFSAVEKAKALRDFHGEVFESAALAWFDQQPDQAEAYLKFASGELAIDLKSEPAAIPIIDETGGKIRNKPITAQVRGWAQAAAAATDPSLSLKLVSGGQNSLREGGPRTGSTRHDHGNSGDFVLMRDGKPVTPVDDPELYARFLENAAAAGATGIGHYDWGVHIGGGSVAAWGPDTTSKTLDPMFAEAIERGRSGPRLDPAGMETRIDIRKAIAPEKISQIEAEMRARISFQNSMEDRQRVAEERQMREAQEAYHFTLAERLVSNPSQLEERGLQPVSVEEIRRSVSNGDLSGDQGRAMLDAYQKQNASVTDPGVEKELIARMFAGNDVQAEILSARDRLTGDDMRALLNQNRTLNGSTDEFSKDGKFYFDRLKDALTQDSLLKDADAGAEMRRFNALAEYKARVAEGTESPELISRDILERANREISFDLKASMNNFLTPRFAVPAGQGLIDLQASAVALHEAHKAGKIDDASYQRQVKLWNQWKRAQEEYERANNAGQ